MPTLLNEISSKFSQNIFTKNTPLKPQKYHKNASINFQSENTVIPLQQGIL